MISSLQSIRRISPLHRAYTACFRVVSPFSTSKKSGEGQTFGDVKEALLTYKSIHGDLLIPTSYKVAEDDARYASHLRGMKLGGVVKDIRNSNAFSEPREELMAMGFPYENIRRPRNFGDVKEALLTYKSIHGDLLVPYSYKVAEDDARYASHLRGMPLGIAVKDIRYSNAFSESREELENIHRPSNFEDVKEALLKYKSIFGDSLFPYSPFSTSKKSGEKGQNFGDVKEALLTYKSIYGDLLVPTSYKVAEDDARYASHLRGMKLGSAVSIIRNSNALFEHREELMAMGFQYENIHRPSNFEHVKEALLTYKSIYGDLLVPANYKVAEDDARYPSHLRGMKLGGVVKDIRNSNTLFEHREELMAMGFPYENIHRPSNFKDAKEPIKALMVIC